MEHTQTVVQSSGPVTEVHPELGSAEVVTVERQTVDAAAVSEDDTLLQRSLQSPGCGGPEELGAGGAAAALGHEQWDD